MEPSREEQLGLLVFEEAMRIADLWIEARQPYEEPGRTMYIVQPHRGSRLRAPVLVKDADQADGWGQAAHVLRVFAAFVPPELQPA